MDKMHRAQILLEPNQHKSLAEIARKQGTSISEIVRMAVNQWLEERDEDEILRRRLEALQQIDLHRQTILERRDGQPLEIDVAGNIEHLREERDAERLTSFGHRR